MKTKTAYLYLCKMRKHWIEAIIHIIFWGSTSLLIASSFSIQSHNVEIRNGEEIVNIVRNNDLIIQTLFCIFVSALLFYINSRIIYKLNLKNNKKTIRYSAMSFLVALIVVYFATNNFTGNYLPLPRQIVFGIVIFYFAISIAYGLAKQSLYNQQRHQQLVIDKNQTELALLRSQIQPHFLFNALNNLLSMVSPADNPKLHTSFEQLSQLLRYVIDETKIEKVSITKEIAFLKNYIELQLLRFSENEVDVNFEVIGKKNLQMVEPGLFITFVENAFKYGTEPEKRAHIGIQFDLTKEHTIHFQIKNKEMLKKTDGNGTGIETTKKRLELIYPKKHFLSITNTEEIFIVELTLKTV